MRLPVLTIEETTERQLCVGCGICAAVEPDRFRMGESFELGRRPFVREGASETTGEGMACCPGAHLSHEETVRTEWPAAKPVRVHGGRRASSL